MQDIDHIFEGLGRSAFRRRFRLGASERRYVRDKSLPVVMGHARDFVERRLAPAEPANDGKQTPFRGHPVFIAQHATATCCRACLQTWHGISRGRALSGSEKDHVLVVLERWIRKELGPDAP
ncbi:DUF4186 domain-containing protein [Microvirga pudoricolor]|uniref:DUF4186 domain-containing protein n=1 Tax=Microvirga pudoricolor TaxID=2778729 RepID=UPI001951AE56|nr:DUF4186 domain-containing protein [Microvirga pudoricolor]MBM6595714.1 DUF4186 domain-containing protein [Microvirga pudoricolor]